MNNFGNNGGSPAGGMKRPLRDPRLLADPRLQGRFGPGRGRGPPQQQFPPGRGGFPPMNRGQPGPPHQQQLPMGGPGRGRPGPPPQQPPFGPGRGRPPGHQPPLGGPGRGFPMRQQSGPGRGFPMNQGQQGQQHQQQFPPGPGRGFPMHQGQPAPPPPPPRRPGPPMNMNQNRIHNVPPAPMMGFGQNNLNQMVGRGPLGQNNMNHMGGRGPPAPPPPRQPFQPQQHQQLPHLQHQQAPPRMLHSSPPRHQQQPVQQQGGMMSPFRAQQTPPQHHHQQPHNLHHQPQNQFPPRGPGPMNSNIVHPQQQRPTYPAMPTAVAKSPQPVPTVATASPKNVSTPYSSAQIDQAWSEHTNNGVKYYHNSILQTSTYTKPEALPKIQGQQQQQQAAQARQPTKVVEASNAQTSSSTWTEYTDTKTGKKYYSNGVTTTWEKPDGFVSPSAIVAQSNAAEEASSSTLESAKKKRKVTRETPFRNSEEAVAAFKGLLLAKGVSPTQKWNEVVKMCSSDSRWEDCEAVLTTGERKQAMAEYQTKRFNDLKDQERQERARAKDAYNQLLSEVLPKLPSFHVLKTKFSQIRDKLSTDDRFYAVPTEGQRETLYLDFCEEMRKHDERKRRNKKRETQDAFCAFLKEKEEAGTLKFSSTWNNFLSSLSQADKEDSRIKISPALLDPDRQLYFADFVIELQAAEDDKRRRIRDARRRAEKAQRDAYRDALEKFASEGKITPSSHWRDIERIIGGDSAYEAVLEQDRDAPRELFEEFIDEWDEIYRRDRHFLSQLVHPSSNREILVTRDTKYDAFVKALLEEAKNSPQTHSEAKRITKTSLRSSARLYFNELVNKAKEKNALPYRRRNLGSRRGSMVEDSSEDEGEIIEDGEVKNEETAAPTQQETTDGEVKNEDTATPTKQETTEGESATNAEEKTSNQEEASDSKESQPTAQPEGAASDKEDATEKTKDSEVPASNASKADSEVPASSSNTESTEEKESNSEAATNEKKQEEANVVVEVVASNDDEANGNADKQSDVKGTQDPVASEGSQANGHKDSEAADDKEAQLAANKEATGEQVSQQSNNMEEAADEKVSQQTTNIEETPDEKDSQLATNTEEEIDQEEPQPATNIGETTVLLGEAVQEIEPQPAATVEEDPFAASMVVDPDWGWNNDDD